MTKVTIKDIAVAGGVSAATVSLVLNDKTDEIGSKTVKRIKKLAEEMGYERNQVARSLVTQRSETIAVVIPDIHNLFYAAIVKSVIEEATKRSYSVILCDTNNDVTEELHQLKILDNKLIDGILLASRNSEKLLESYENRRNLPIVILDEFNLNDRDNVYVVASDNQKSAYKMTSYLLDLGHRDIFCLGGVLGSTNSVHRYNGVKQALDEREISYSKEQFVLADYKSEKAYEIVKKIEDFNYTAVICFNDLMAYGVIKALSEKKLRVPEDVSVVCFDNNSSHSLVAQLSQYTVTSINQNEELIGQEATGILLDALGDKKTTERVHLLGADWLEGNTTRSLA